MFSKLQTRLTVAYAGMFGLVLALVAVGVFVGISHNAERTIRGELQASGAVFDRVWALKSHQLHDGADLLSRDFGFRAAVATNDAATVQSALDNLKTRQHVSRAFIVGVDGALTGAAAASIGGGADGLWRALDADPDAAGVLMIDGQPHEAVAAPIMAPTLAGWVVFASRLDREEVRALESLSSIPLHASILTGAPASGWRPAFERVTDRDRGAMNALIDRALHKRDRAPDRLQTSDGDAVALVKPLKSLGQGASTVLLLRYPMAAGLAPYRSLLVILVLGGLLGLLLVLAGSWVLARGLTRPISLLQHAAQLMRQGKASHVAVPRSSEEIGRLADSFNAMSEEIGQREARITHLALHDPETDLPNGVALEQGLRALVAKDGEGVVVIAVGIDRFTHVRGAIGYRLASLLVAEIGARLRSIDPDMALGRLSSDMLGVAFRTPSLQATLAQSEAVLRVLEKPVRLGDASVDVTLTTGIAAWGEHGADVATLIERSSIALDQARARRVKVGVFDAAAYGDPAGQLSLMSEMLDALASCEMAVHYQPKLDIRKGAIVGAEALVRWRHPVRGMMRPDLFVEMAEETGHIRALSNWVLDRAIADQAELRIQGHDLSISVNISGRLMDDRPFADAALARIAAAGADICFEITETAVIERPEVALEIIAACSAAGVEISIDDYGSGLSSLAYLKQIQANELKIDKAFILSLAEGRRDVLLVKSTIDLAHSLGLKVTAEGVETPEALAILAGMGCDLAQGYLIARPMPLEALVTILDAADVPSPKALAAPEQRRSA